MKLISVAHARRRLCQQPCLPGCLNVCIKSRNLLYQLCAACTLKLGGWYTLDHISLTGSCPCDAVFVRAKQMHAPCQNPTAGFSPACLQCQPLVLTLRSAVCRHAVRAAVQPPTAPVSRRSLGSLPLACCRRPTAAPPLMHPPPDSQQAISSR